MSKDLVLDGLTEDEVVLRQLRVADLLVHGVAVVGVGVAAEPGGAKPRLHLFGVVVERGSDGNHHGLPGA